MKISKYVTAFLLLAASLVLMFVQHLAAFDVFESNLWYLYLLVILAACLQYVLLLLSRKQVFFETIRLICLTLYAIAASVGLWQLLSAFRYDPYPLGLTVVCLFMDAIGAILTLYLKPNNTEPDFPELKKMPSTHGDTGDHSVC